MCTEFTEFNSWTENEQGLKFNNKSYLGIQSILLPYMRDVFGVFQFYNFLTQTDGEREREIEARNNQKIRREKEKLHSKNTYKTLAPPPSLLYSLSLSLSL